MNKLQFVFLISLLLPFSFLFLVSRVLIASLDKAGFHFSNLILIGLPKDPQHPEMGNFSFADLRSQLSAVDLPLLGTVDLLSSTALITAAVVLGGFALMALFPKGTSLRVARRVVQLTSPQAGPRYSTPPPGKSSPSSKRPRCRPTPQCNMSAVRFIPN